MTAVIPNLELVNASSSVSYDAGGVQIAPGMVSDSTLLWVDPGLTATYVFDIYEDGAPMADGRTFQVSCTANTAATVNGPYWEIPFRAQLQNVPIVYLRNNGASTSIRTCIHNNLGFAGAQDAVFIEGAFYLGGPAAGQPLEEAMVGICHLPAWKVPIFVTAANALGTPLETLDSSAYSWSLASNALSNSPGLRIIPVYSAGVGFIGAPAYTLVEERRGVLPRVADIIAFNFGWPYIGGISADTSTSSAIRAPIQNTSSAGLRVYRRGSTSATYDWPGLQRL